MFLNKPWFFLTRDFPNVGGTKLIPLDLSCFPEYFYEFWVFFRRVYISRNSIFRIFRVFFQILCIFPDFSKKIFRVFFRFLSIFRVLAEKGSGSWILGSHFFPTMLRVAEHIVTLVCDSNKDTILLMLMLILLLMLMMRRWPSLSHQCTCPLSCWDLGLKIGSLSSAQGGRETRLKANLKQIKRRITNH